MAQGNRAQSYSPTNRQLSGQSGGPERTLATLATLRRRTGEVPTANALALDSSMPAQLGQSRTH